MKIDDLFSDPESVKILYALRNMQAFTTTELSNICRLSYEQTQLVVEKLIHSEFLFIWGKRNRKYYRLIDKKLADQISQKFSDFNHHIELKERKIQDSELAECRSCYGHLAGKVGIGICKAMIEQKIIISKDEKFSLSHKGIEFFKSLNISDNDILNNLRPCLDFSERKYHLSGKLGDEMLTQMIKLNWLKRKGTSRKLALTPIGKQEIKIRLGIEF